MARGLIVALQFLTRLPVPAVGDLHRGELSRSAVWFPLVGLIVGGIVATLLAAGALIDSWLGALLGLVAWIWVTGGLHLDGLADLADALGAAHRDPGRFIQVLRDPHVGAFGAMVLVLAIASKLVLLGVASRQWTARWPDAWFALPLIAAWARLGAVVWSAWLPVLAPGTAERFARPMSKSMLGAWGIVLLSASAILVPALVLAPAAIWACGEYCRRRIGGVTGDCLGAGVELTEIALLVALVVSTGWPTLSA